MTDELQSKSTEVVESAAKHAETIENARIAQMKSAFNDSMEEYFGHGNNRKRFIDVERIPFICEDIRKIHSDVETMRNDAKWLKWLLTGIVGGIGALAMAYLLK